MRIGLIGTGAWGSNLAKYLVKYADDLTIMRSDSGLRTGFERVIIATPPETHYELAKYYLEMGIGVFLEKPMTTSYEQSLELYKLSKDNKCQLFIDYTLLYNNGVKDIIKIIEEDGGLKFFDFKTLKKGDVSKNIHHTLTVHHLAVLNSVVNIDELVIDPKTSKGASRIDFNGKVSGIINVSLDDLDKTFELTVTTNKGRVFSLMGDTLYSTRGEVKKYDNKDILDEVIKDFLFNRSTIEERDLSICKALEEICSKN